MAPLPDALPIIAYGITLIALCLLVRNAASQNKSPLPPGPTPFPLLGNLFDLPVTHEYQTYAQWGKEYGDIVYVTVLGKHIVVLNSVKVAKELLHSRSAIYSDRPYVPMLQEPSLMDSDQSFVFKPYAPQWRRQRRIFTKHLNPSASRIYLEAQTVSAHSLLRSTLRTPDHFVAHLRHAAAQWILAITYGYEIQQTDDPLVALAEYTVKTVGEGALPGRFLVNVFSWLKYVPAWAPGAGFKNFAAKGKEAGRKLSEIPFEDAKRRIAHGIASESFVTTALTDPSSDALHADIKSVAATMYGTAADTSVSTLQSCLLALVLNPSVQVRAQAELDSVLGSATSPTFHLPTFTDRPRLPYIDAIVKESLRWFPVAPIGVPHATSEEDVYRGWRIPKGTIVIANSWSMLRDEKIYPDPLTFRPERFLGENPDPHPESQGCFGFGRRECPGRHLAESSLWIQIASLLAVFMLSPAKDEHGREIDVSYAHKPAAGLVLHPRQFPCTITPRSREAIARICETDPAGDWSE